MRYFLLILFFISFLFLPAEVHASGFYLKKIGTVDVEGKTYKQFWYNNPSLTFTGSAETEATVVAEINDTSQSITADSEGNWSLSTVLNEGDNSVSFSSGGSTIAMTLTVGSMPEVVEGSSPSATPVAGTPLPTLILFAAGAGLVTFGIICQKRFASV